jgi:ribonuclease E
MLIDSTHPEETRVVVLRGNRVEEFDFESADRRQLRGNIYLAKVTRVEPSLQAAFVDYGGNRHGFLAFSEIHPDYYQIPFADRQALLQEQARDDQEQAEREEAKAEREAEKAEEQAAAAEREAEEAAATIETITPIENPPPDEDSLPSVEAMAAVVAPSESITAATEPEAVAPAPVDFASSEIGVANDDAAKPFSAEPNFDIADVAEAVPQADAASEAPASSHEGLEFAADNPAKREAADHEREHEEDKVESVGAEDALEEVPERRKPRPRQYKIQEVIKRRQVLLVQVVKEERGNKGAALTTYLSLAGRYSVLMPNTARGGGISRKITTPLDRKRLKSIAQELEVPSGMGVILRTAGANRTKAEIKRDFEYLLRLWENVRELTLRSTAPKLVYEEGSLIKRSIRDLYSREIDQVVVAGDDAYREAKDFMRMLMPSHARNVQLYKDNVPVFSRNGVEAQLDAMFSPQVTLKSGGYIVINQTEALVSIDVNSGRSTREHSIEDTALNTNLEAAEEIARQLRLRDLAGLIVIDFIDMEEKRNNRSVERKLKDCLRADRARIQVGRISHFGLMEMSRQRIRTGVLESSTVSCPHCRGTGQVRSVSSLSLQILRALDDHLLRHSGHELLVRTRPEVALYVLNQKRRHLAELEARFGTVISITGELPENGAGYSVERGAPIEERPERPPASPASEAPPAEVSAEPETEVEFEADETRERDEGGEGGRERRRRRRRRRGGNGDDRYERHRDDREERPRYADAPSGEEDLASEGSEEPADASVSQRDDHREMNGDGDGRDSRRRRRGRRGGRRRGRGREGGEYRDENRQAEPYGEGNAEPAYAGEDDRGSEGEAFDANDELSPGIGDPHAEEIEALTKADSDEARREEPAAQNDRGYQPVHEPEAVSKASEPAEPPRGEPVVTPPPPPEEDNRPKRTGWWSRKSSFL